MGSLLLKLIPISNISMPPAYDTIIVGGGIAGLYTAYHTLKRRGSVEARTVLVLECSGRLGGRIYTYKGPHIHGELGAGRLHNGHRYLMALLRELGLDHHLYKIPGTSYDNDDYMLKLLRKLVRAPHHSTFSGNVLEYADQVAGMTKDEIQYVVDHFGYYSELVLMSAPEALHTIHDMLRHDNQYYSFAGGMSKIIDELTTRIQHMGGKILRRKRVVEVLPDLLHTAKTQRTKSEMVSSGMEIICDDGIHYLGKKCILCIPKEGLQSIRFPGQPIPRSLISSVVTAPLCRIYAVYERDASTGKVWFADKNKQPIPNPIRMFIPIDKEQGIIMVSYTDNKYADYWHRVYQQGGYKLVGQRLRAWLLRGLQIDTGVPKYLKMVYWPSGVGYWRPGTDSKRISKEMTQPIPSLPLYVCGENYSWKNQQWIEGALETAHIVLQQTR